MANVLKYLKHQERFFETSIEREKLFGNRCCVPLDNGQRCKRKSIGWLKMDDKKDNTKKSDTIDKKKTLSKYLDKRPPDDDSKYKWIYIIRCHQHNDKCVTLQKYYKEQYRKIKPLGKENDKDSKKIAEDIRKRFNSLKLCNNNMKVPEVKKLITLLHNNYKGRRKFDKECISNQCATLDKQNFEKHNYEEFRILKNMSHCKKILIEKTDRDFTFEEYKKDF